LSDYLFLSEEQNIRNVLRKEPLLKSCGIVDDDYDTEFGIRWDHIYKVADLLLSCKKTIKTYTNDSYYLKHVVERALRAYTMNGELIAAALLVGYEHKRIYTISGKLTPNCNFNISEKAVKYLVSQDQHAGW
jgi:hypothetical protein